MIKLIKYTKNWFCSFCGSDKPTNALQYKSSTREAVIPICDDCYAELTKKEGKKNATSRRTKRTINKDEEPVDGHKELDGHTEAEQ